MNNKIINSIIVIVTIAIASLSIFVACTEEDITDTNSIIKKSTNNEGSIIGYYDIDEKTFELNFSDIEFAQLYKDEVRKEHGIDVNVELVKIEDENPQNPKYYSYLMFRVYDIDNDCLLINMLELKKDYNEEDGKIYYAPSSSASSPRGVSCKSEGCGVGECIIKTNWWGKAIDCTACEDGKCDKYINSYSSDINWLGIGGLVVNIIKLFV